MGGAAPTAGSTGGWVRESVWAYPALEIAHLAGVALLVGSLFVLELRVFGAGRALAPRALARLSLPVALAGFALAAASGLAMFAAQPLELLPNAAFRTKMLLVFVAGANAALFHLRGSLERGDAIAKAQALASLGLWFAVLACGRLIAYV